MKDWKTVFLPEACDILDNLRKPINSAERNRRIAGKSEQELYPYYGATGQVGFIDDYLTDGEFVLIGEDAAPFLDPFKDVAYMIKGKTWVNNHAHVLNSRFNNKYLCYFLNQFNYKDFVTGTTRLKLTQGAMKRMTIKIAPLPEQRAIVARIEELFSELDHAIANLKSAQAKLEIYRQAVLKKAFEGGFVENNKKGINGLPFGWSWIKSGDLFSFVTSGSRGWAKYYSDSGAIFIRITNLNFDTLDINLNQGKIQYVSPPNDTEGIRTKVQEGDFLFSITGYLGMFAIAPKLDDAYVNQHVSLCRPKEGFNKRFVGYWLISKSGGLRHMNENKKGAVKAGLNLDDLKSIPIPMPENTRIQDKIVQEIESRLSVADKLAETIQTNLLKSESLRQSILKQAFEGKLLTEAELEACRKEADWEPAEKLLERIIQEKNKSKKL